MAERKEITLEEAEKVRYSTRYPDGTDVPMKRGPRVISLPELQFVGRIVAEILGKPKDQWATAQEVQLWWNKIQCTGEGERIFDEEFYRDLKNGGNGVAANPRRDLRVREIIFKLLEEDTGPKKEA